MDHCDSELNSLRLRMSGIKERLAGPWAESLRSQLHLDRDTTECAYWHSGYHQALADLLGVVSKTQAIFDTSGTTSPRPAAG